MTELALYRYIADNGIETHIYRNGRSMVDMSEWTEDNHKQWKVYIFPLCSQLQAFVDICSEGIFEYEGVECTLKRGYVAIDLNEIMSYYGLEPNVVFSTPIKSI